MKTTINIFRLKPKTSEKNDQPMKTRPVDATRTLNSQDFGSFSRDSKPTKRTMKHVIVMAACAVAMWSMPGHAATVAYWQFEPGALTNDSSGNGHTLLNSGVTSSGNVSTNAPGSGSAYFNGASIMSTVASLNLTNFTALTVEWFEKPQMATPSTAAILWEQSANYNNLPYGAIVATVNSTGSDNEYASQRTGSGTFYNGVSASIPGGTTNGGWHHYAMTLDVTNATSHCKLYIDGSLVGTESSGGQQSLVNASFYLGARSGGVAPYTGFIDELRISDQILSPSQFLIIPEPTVLALLACACGAMVGWRRREI